MSDYEIESDDDKSDKDDTYITAYNVLFIILKSETSVREQCFSD